MTPTSEPTMPDPTVPLSDLAHLLPALAREAVTVEWEGSQRGALLFANPEDGYCVAATTYAHARGPASGFLLVLDPPTVRAMAVVIAEAVGLDARGGAVAYPMGFHGRPPSLYLRGYGDPLYLDWPADLAPVIGNTGLALVAVARSLAGVRDV